jgi:hypothetical protein
MSDSVHDRIVTLSHGLPHYTHLLALESGRSAIDRDSSNIEDADFKGALGQIVKTKHTIANEYYSAVRSAHESGKHKITLLACALTKPDIQGFFQASAVAGTMECLFGTGWSRSNIQRHLTDFIAAKRGNVLEREGLMGRFRYRFANPLLLPYTIISSLWERLITDEKVWALEQEHEISKETRDGTGPAMNIAVGSSIEKPLERVREVTMT